MRKARPPIGLDIFKRLTFVSYAVERLILANEMGTTIISQIIIMYFNGRACHVNRKHRRLLRIYGEASL